jgi:hypothetical protein
LLVGIFSFCGIAYGHWPLCGNQAFQEAFEEKKRMEEKSLRHSNGVNRRATVMV